MLIGLGKIWDIAGDIICKQMLFQDMNLSCEAVWDFEM